MGNYVTTPEEAQKVAAESGDVYPAVEFDGPSSIILPANASVLSKEELIDRIKGIIYGNCLGDAIGLATEFMNKAEAKEIYKGKELNMKMFHRDQHRGRWQEGDWTDDSDQMLLIMDGIFGNGGKIDEIDFAKRLKYWVHHGFPELGDLGGLGIGATVNSVVNSRDFLTTPHDCANAVWKRSNKFLAANGAVMRTSILGIPNFNDISKVIENTKKICYTTHTDPRCVASCVAVTTLIALILQKGIPKDGVNSLLREALNFARQELDPKDSGVHGLVEFEEYVNVKNLQELKLDDSKSIGYTYKCLGSAIYCFRTGTDFKKSITELVMEAGDADTNAAVAGALLGAKLGYNQLPRDWLNDLKEIKWLDKKVNRFFQMLGLVDEIKA